MYCSDQEQNLESITYRVSLFLSINISFNITSLFILYGRKVSGQNFIFETYGNDLKIVIGVGLILQLFVYSMIKITNIIEKSRQYFYKNPPKEPLSTLIFIGYPIASFFSIMISAII
ncbi:MAG: hypothetical protein R3E32_15025 [Chitinophagales bacterium]